MTHDPLHRDYALFMAADKAYQAGNLAHDAMNGHDVDPSELNTLLCQSVAALQVAYPDDIHRQTLRMIMIRLGLSATIPGHPANDQFPIGAA